jgi:hypothetical protein
MSLVQRLASEESHQRIFGESKVTKGKFRYDPDKKEMVQIEEEGIKPIVGEKSFAFPDLVKGE